MSFSRLAGTWAWKSAGVGLACGALVACSASHNGSANAGGSGGTAGGGPGGSTGGDTSAGGGGSGGTGIGGGIGGGIGPGGSGGGTSGCDDATKGNIYILGQDKQFARFEPQTQTLI